MLLLNILILCSLVSNNFEENETTSVTLEGRLKEHLDSDPTTKHILEEVYKKPMTIQFKGLLHLSLNYLLVSNEILASPNPEDSPGLNQVPEFIQKKMRKC